MSPSHVLAPLCLSFQVLGTDSLASPPGCLSWESGDHSGPALVLGATSSEEDSQSAGRRTLSGACPAPYGLKTGQPGGPDVPAAAFQLVPPLWDPRSSGWVPWEHASPVVRMCARATAASVTTDTGQALAGHPTPEPPKSLVGHWLWSWGLSGHLLGLRTARQEGGVGPRLRLGWAPPPGLCHWPRLEFQPGARSASPREAREWAAARGLGRECVFGEPSRSQEGGVSPRCLGDWGRVHLRVLRARPSCRPLHSWSAVPPGREEGSCHLLGISRTPTCQTKSLTEDGGNEPTKAASF